MHPGFYAWWRFRHDGRHHGGPANWAAEHAAGCEAEGDIRARLHDAFERHRRHHHEHHAHGPHEGMHVGPHFEADPGSPFGVRRPLRFLAHKLELNEQQVASFAGILDELKTERAQASVDQRRRISALADAVENNTFDAGKATNAGDEHVKSAERLRAAVESALKRMHAALDDEQRKKLAYLLRTGMLSI